MQIASFSVSPRGTIQLMLKMWMRRWGPAALMMSVIFVFSSLPSTELPRFGIWDYLVKKGGHTLGYGLLALAYWRGWDMERGKRRLAWILAICYALTDEVHQAFVPGRYPSLLDVMVFDNLGALISLWLLTIFKTRRSDAIHPIDEKVSAKSG